MQENNHTSMQEVLERMTTERLDELLNSELDKGSADGDSVRMILNVLWEREKDDPAEITPEIEKAWAEYKKNIAKVEAAEERSEKFRRWILRAASAAAVLCLLVFALPQKAGAESFFEKLARWTDSIMEFFSPGLGNDNLSQYEFKTDNTDLQQVYDAVMELSVTDPVVPMWLPEGYKLAACETLKTSHKNGISVCFKNDKDGIVFKVDAYTLDISHEYHWDGIIVGEYERGGIKHTIMRNNDRWVVIWLAGNAECSLTLDCQEDTLYKILDSIYVMEDKQ